MSRPQTFTKIDLKPKRHHGYSVVLFLFGTLFPPLAVAARFGIGTDFWLNLFLTIAGYIPGHVHNFYIQNIRNNKNNKRTPKWAIRYGLINDKGLERKKRKSQWATRYDERLPNSTLEGQEYEDGQNPENLVDVGNEGSVSANRAGAHELWGREDEGYYGETGSTKSGDSGAGRWHYPANFEDAEPDVSTSGKPKKKKKKDRWAMTEDARMGSVEMDDGSRKKKKKKRSSSKRRTVDDGMWADNASRGSDSFAEGPEDAVGGLYGNGAGNGHAKVPEDEEREGQEIFDHQF